MVLTDTSLHVLKNKIRSQTSGMESTPENEFIHRVLKTAPCLSQVSDHISVYNRYM